MFRIITRLPLTIKLLLICLIPIALSIYFSVLIYNQKTERIQLIETAIDRIHESASIQELIIALSFERRYSFNYLQKNERLEKLQHQINVTDSLIKHLETTNPRRKNFTEYTLLDDLNSIRKGVQNDSNFSVRTAINYYTAAITRINMMDESIHLSDLFLKENFQDLMSQNIMTKMLALMSTVRTQIYMALYSQGFISKSSIGSSAYYKMFKTYELELQMNSTPETLKKYDSVLSYPSYSRMIKSLDNIFSDSFNSDSTYNAEDWWEITSQGLTYLRSVQMDLYAKSENKLVSLYKKEKSDQKKSMIFLLISISLVIIIILYFAAGIIKSLRELEYAAHKISKGNTGILINSNLSGLLGNLARSILQIEKNNLVLANAANEIGKGNFDVAVNPRSKYDLLGHSLEKMREDLKEFNSQKDQIQKETLQLVQNRDEFFSMTSHELKTPVTSLKAYTQLLLMNNNFLDEKSREMLAKMDQQINKLVTLINDLLDTSRLQYGEMEYSKEILKLNALVQDVIQEVKLSNPEHKIILQKNVHGLILGNPDRLRQVINNLIGNAIKYAPNSKEIIIRLEKTENKIIFSIRDFGYGVKEDDIPFIFDRFYRVSEDNLNTYPGLGVGLYISNEFIKRHGGKMWLESEYGKGSTFYFELPLVEQ
jgi:signal transduction histidine kinase